MRFSFLLLLLPSLLMAQAPSGLTGWINMDEWCASPTPFGATMIGVDPSRTLKVLDKARLCHKSIVVVYPRRIVTANGENVGPYSPANHRKASDAYAKVLTKTVAASYLADKTLLGLVTGDDFGCAACYGGTPIPFTEARDAANYAKSKMPWLPVGIRLSAVQAKEHVPQGGWQFDFFWAQWIASAANLRKYKTADAWIAANVAVASQLGMRQFYGINTGHCTGDGTPPCTPAEVTKYGTPAADAAQTCGLLSWRYNDGIGYSGDYRKAWNDLFVRVRTKPFTPCKVR